MLLRNERINGGRPAVEEVRDEVLLRNRRQGNKSRPHVTEPKRKAGDAYRSRMELVPDSRSLENSMEIASNDDLSPGSEKSEMETAEHAVHRFGQALITAAVTGQLEVIVKEAA